MRFEELAGKRPHQLQLLFIVVLSSAACSDSGSNGTPSPVPDASDGSTVDQATIPKDQSVGDADADVSRADGSDAACPNPVQHGGGCATEASTACGYQRSCTDVAYRNIVTCSCNAGHWRCGTCPSCNVDQRALGCGIGQTCDTLNLRQCDGTTATINSTCTCGFGDILWSCDNGQTVHRCADAGADAQPDGPDSSPVDGSIEPGDASAE